MEMEGSEWSSEGDYIYPGVALEDFSQGGGQIFFTGENFFSRGGFNTGTTP